MNTTSSSPPWSGARAGSQACASGPFPRRAFEIGAIVVGFIYFWPAAVAYVAWKIAGYPGLPQMRDFAQTGQWNGGGISRFAKAFEAAKDRGAGRYAARRASSNFAFDEYRQAELARLEERRRQLQEESRAFAEFVEELRRAKDREEFDAFMAKRRAEPGKESGKDGPVIDA